MKTILTLILFSTLGMSGVGAISAEPASIVYSIEFEEFDIDTDELKEQKPNLTNTEFWNAVRATRTRGGKISTSGRFTPAEIDELSSQASTKYDTCLKDHAQTIARSWKIIQEQVEIRKYLDVDPAELRYNLGYTRNFVYTSLSIIDPKTNKALNAIANTELSRKDGCHTNPKVLAASIRNFLED